MTHMVSRARWCKEKAELTCLRNSGMTDLLPKPFSRDQLYSMLEVRTAPPELSFLPPLTMLPLQRHLSHLKAAKRYAIHIPPSVGVPPLSDQGVNDALRYSAAHYDKILEGYHNPEEVPMWNPLGGSGTSDAQFIQMIGVSRIHSVSCTSFNSASLYLSSSNP